MVARARAAVVAALLAIAAAVLAMAATALVVAVAALAAFPVAAQAPLPTPDPQEMDSLTQDLLAARPGEGVHEAISDVIEINIDLVGE